MIYAQKSNESDNMAREMIFMNSKNYFKPGNNLLGTYQGLFTF